MEGGRERESIQQTSFEDVSQYNNSSLTNTRAIRKMKLHNFWWNPVIVYSDTQHRFSPWLITSQLCVPSQAHAKTLMVLIDTNVDIHVLRYSMYVSQILT